MASLKMKRWSETIQFSEPPRDIREAAATLSPEQEKRVLERERFSYERGRAEGERSLSEQLLQQRSEFQALQQGILGALQKAVPALVRDSEASLVTLAFEVARKVVGDLPISSGMIEASIKEALNQVEHHCNIDLLINPEDLMLLQRTNSPLLSQECHGNRMKINPSTEVTRGGCILRTDFGTIDARHEVKFATIRSSLEEGV